MRVRRASLAAGLLAVIAGCVVRSPTSPTVDAGRDAASRQAAPAARPALDRATSANLGDLALLWQARDAQSVGDLDAVREAAATLAERHPDSVWAGDVYLLAGLAARRQGNLAEARHWLADALPRLDDTSAQWRRAAIALAETSARVEDDPTALRLARSLREKHPRGVADRRARRLTDRVWTRRPDLEGGPEQQLEEAALRLREGDAAWARATADRLASSGGSLGSRALLVRAQAEHALGERGSAEATCKLVSQTAAPATAAEALVLAARWRWNADDDAGAQVLFERAQKRAPGSPPATEATYALGRIAQEHGQWDHATQQYAAVARTDDATLARAGRWGSAWVPYLAGDWSRAAAAFTALAAREDADALAARYWQARALERAGDVRGSELLHHLAVTEPDTYYGWMARQRLGIQPAPVEPITPPARPPFPSALQSAHARRARALLELGLPRLARREVDALRGSEDPELIVRAYEAVGAPEAAIRLAANLPRTDGTRRYLYPLGHWDVVRTAAEREGLDPLFVQALIRQESAFAARAVSPADAYGLMQLLPSTAAEVAAAHGQPPPDRARLTEVGTNVALGTALLSRLLARYGGSEIKALAAYNAGEDAVHKWEGRYGQRDDDEFVELISFRETKRYVKVVLENYQVYRTLYTPSAVTSDRGNPPNAPFDMMTMTSPVRADATR
jgi:soluble lytic murein transglycosylase